MGPYGVDRAVHALEFNECENGLGKLSVSFGLCVCGMTTGTLATGPLCCITYCMYSQHHYFTISLQEISSYKHKGKEYKSSKHNM